jgi:hypothetical protein
MKIQQQNISEYFRIESSKLNELGVFDRFVGIDSKLFVDPFLFENLDIPEFKDSREKIKNHFRKVIKLLLVSKNSNDLPFKQAVRFLTFEEVKGVGIGYGKNTGDGNCIGPKLARKLAEVGKEIVDFGITDPEIFELLGLFQEDYGADRLSDLTIRILHEEFVQYSVRITKELGISNIKKEYKDRDYQLPYIKELGSFVKFLPKKCLRDLPIAHDKENIDYVVSFNEDLRHKLNQLVGEDWSKHLKKPDLKSSLLDNKDAIRDLVSHYQNKKPLSYNFNEDPKGEISWKAVGEKIAHENKLELSLPKSPSIEDVKDVVVEIIKKFKKNVEFNGANKLLKKGNGRIGEEFCQRVFYIVADSYCTANNLDLTAEGNGGRGPVDFKMSRGLQKIVVEVKLTSNSKFLDGIKKQLPTYEKVESAKGIFLIIKTSESNTQVSNLQSLELEYKRNNLTFPDYFVVDAFIKPSASKL